MDLKNILELKNEKLADIENAVVESIEKGIDEEAIKKGVKDVEALNAKWIDDGAENEEDDITDTNEELLDRIKMTAVYFAYVFGYSKAKKITDVENFEDDLELEFGLEEAELIIFNLIDEILARDEASMELKEECNIINAYIEDGLRSVFGIYD